MIHPINQIRAAQVRAGEDVVTANLRSMGLSVNQRQPRANQDVHQVLGEALYDQARTRYGRSPPPMPAATQTLT